MNNIYSNLGKVIDVSMNQMNEIHILCKCGTIVINAYGDCCSQS